MPRTKATAKHFAPLTGSFFLIFLLLSPHLNGQSREQVRAEAETALQTMTPAEIDAKLKELGVTREEATVKAKAYGISLDQYLSRTSLPADTSAGETFGGRGATGLQSDPRLLRGLNESVVPRDIVRGVTPGLAAVKLPVPGFTDRDGVPADLQPFGFDVFQYSSTFFTPSAAAAPPSSYALGPGDEIVLSLWGETRLNSVLAVNREGNVVVPDVGPINAGGLTVAQLQEKLQKRLSTVYSSLQGGTRARTFLDLSLGKLKNIQVYVVGEVQRPGGYSIPSMSTVLTALYSAGGPTIVGSMRNIQIIRKGDQPQAADLYRFLLQWDKSPDVSLLDGDILVVPPAARRAAIVGSITRPAIYETKEGETLGDLLTMAGGLRFDAATKRVSLERIVPFNEREKYDKDILRRDIDFASASAMLASTDRLENGDVVKIYSIDYMQENRVDIDGPVYKPGPYALVAGMRVGDLIRAADSLRETAFPERGTIARIRENLRRELISFNVRKALAGDADENLLLMNRDSVSLYPENNFFPQHTVTLWGAVRHPGDYARRENMTIGDLIVAAGGVTEQGIVTGIEVGRMDTTEVGKYATVKRIDLTAEYWQKTPGDYLLADFDVVSVPENPKFTYPKTVHMTGYVMGPGLYALRASDERLASLFQRAGGLKVGAYLEGARLFRKDAGLVPLDFRKAIEDESSRDNIVLYDGDSIYVPVTSDVIYVTGDVFVPSPILYKKGGSLNYYLEQAGGVKDDADDDRTVVLLPGGKKWEGGGLFSSNEILPGSSIFVPKKVEKEDKTLPILRDVVTILASLAALTVAMVQVTK